MQIIFAKPVGNEAQALIIRYVDHFIYGVAYTHTANTHVRHTLRMESELETDMRLVWVWYRMTRDAGEAVAWAEQENLWNHPDSARPATEAALAYELVRNNYPLGVGEMPTITEQGNPALIREGSEI